MKPHVQILTAIALVLGIAPGFAADWRELAPLPEPRYGAAGAMLDGTVHVIGGQDEGVLGSHVVWSAGDGAWREAAPLAEPRLEAAAVPSGGALYLIGGFDPNGWPRDGVLRFDTATGTWSALAPLPSGRAACGAAAVGAALYVAGGEGDYGLMPNEALRYDVAANTWTPIAALPTKRTGPAVAAFGGRVYVMGGMGTGLPIATVEVYDPARDAWSQGPALPEPLWQAAAAAFGGRLWVAGGINAKFEPTPHVYSLGSDGAWRAEPSLPVALTAAAAGADDARLVLAGGQSAVGPLAAVYEMLAEPVAQPPAETLGVTVAFDPATLDLRSQGRWVTVRLEAEGWLITDLDVASLRLLGAGVDPDAPTSIGDPDGDRRLERTVKFRRSIFASLTGGTHVLCVTGATTAGAPVTGCGTLRVEGDARVGRGRAASPGRFSLTAWGGSIRFAACEPVEATVEVLDVQGRLVDRVFSGVVTSEERTVRWPSTGRAVPAGVYFARLRSRDGQVVTSLVARP